MKNNTFIGVVLASAFLYQNNYAVCFGCIPSMSKWSCIFGRSHKIFPVMIGDECAQPWHNKVDEISRIQKAYRAHRIKQFPKIVKKLKIMCPICFEEDIFLSKMACKHVFHERCLRPWIDMKKNSCPVCRKPLKVQ